MDANDEYFERDLSQKDSLTELFSANGWTELEMEVNNKSLLRAHCKPCDDYLRYTDLSELVSQRPGLYWTPDDAIDLMRLLEKTQSNVLLYVNPLQKNDGCLGGPYLTNPLVAPTDRPFTGAFLYTPQEHLPLSMLGNGFKDGFALEHGRYTRLRMRCRGFRSTTISTAGSR
jgi:hypothetical protein